MSTIPWSLSSRLQFQQQFPIAVVTFFNIQPWLLQRTICSLFPMSIFIMILETWEMTREEWGAASSSNLPKHHFLLRNFSVRLYSFSAFFRFHILSLDIRLSPLALFHIKLSSPPTAMGRKMKDLCARHGFNHALPWA